MCRWGGEFHGPWSLVRGPRSWVLPRMPMAEWMDGQKDTGSGPWLGGQGPVAFVLVLLSVSSPARWSVPEKGFERFSIRNKLSRISGPGSPYSLIPGSFGICLFAFHSPDTIHTEYPVPFFWGFGGTTIRPMKYACWINIIRGMRVNTFVKI